jgi:hypothetical protein
MHKHAIAGADAARRKTAGEARGVGRELAVAPRS